MSNDTQTIALPDEAATLALGAALAGALRPGLIVYLQGDLGSGKTTLVRGLLRALGHAGSVKSPTYALVELYCISRLDLYHFDFYRFERAEEYLDAGLDEYFAGAGVCLVEWPERAGAYLAPADLRVGLRIDRAARLAQLEAGSDAGRACLSAASPAFPRAG
jgi:tRNA threonylcarbamoyladenosine biosynthesis protein TsaE